MDPTHADMAWNAGSASSAPPPPPSEPDTAQGDLMQTEERWPSWEQVDQENPNEPGSWGQWTPPDVFDWNSSSQPAQEVDRDMRQNDSVNDSSRYRQSIWTDPDEPTNVWW